MTDRSPMIGYGGGGKSSAGEHASTSIFDRTERIVWKNAAGEVVAESQVVRSPGKAYFSFKVEQAITVASLACLDADGNEIHSFRLSAWIDPSALFMSTLSYQPGETLHFRLEKIDG